MSQRHAVELTVNGKVHRRETEPRTLLSDFLRGTLPVDARTIQPFGLLHGGASAALAETLAEIGGEWHVSRQRVYQIEEAALIRLRQPGQSQGLRSLLERHSQGEYEWVERVTQAYLRRRGGRREQG